MAKKILFYSSIADKSLFEIQRFYKIDIQILQALGFDVELSNKISDALRFWRYDTAFIYFYKYGFFVALIARIFFKKVYFTGGIDELDKDFAQPAKYERQKLFFKLCYFLSTKCIIVSEADRENVRKIYKNNRSLGKIEFSEHTIDVGSFSPGLSKGKTFTSIAWMEDQMNVVRKGLDKALRLFGYLIEKPGFEDYDFVIVGKTGRGSDALKGLATSMGIIHRVTFTDCISEQEKIKILTHSQYYLQLSLYEGFGIAAIEALAGGNIVIHSARGGLKNTVGDFGITLDINKDETEEFEKVYMALQQYDKTKILDAIVNIQERFSNERRKNDFKIIIK